MDTLPELDLSTLPVVETPTQELDDSSKELVANLNRLQKEVNENKDKNKPKGSSNARSNKILNEKLDAAVEDDGLLAGHREERRKLAERLQNDPAFREQYKRDLIAKSMATADEDNILGDGEYMDALNNELTEEDIAALDDDLEEVGTKKETVDVTNMLKGMGIVFQNVTTVNIYMCDKCHPR